MYNVCFSSNHKKTSNILITFSTTSILIKLLEVTIKKISHNTVLTSKIDILTLLVQNGSQQK